MSEITLESIPIQMLRPNPFRRLEKYPIIRTKVDALKESYRITGFWGGILGRRVDGCVEIAFGHHRLVALQEELGINTLVPILVRDINNEDMIRMMAKENMEEWGTSAWVELETIRSTIDAYGSGKITLPKADPRGGNLKTLTQGSVSKTYTMGTVADFLGWTRKNHENGIQPNSACETAFRALDMIERGLLEEDTLKGLSRDGMKTLVEGQWRIHQAEMRLAKANEEEAKLAAKRAYKATTPIDQFRFEKQAKVFQEQSQNHASAATRKATDFGKAGADKLRSGEGVRKVRQDAIAQTVTVPRASPVTDVDGLAEKTAKQIITRLNGFRKDSELAENIKFLKQNRDDLTADGMGRICGALTELIEHLERVRKTFETLPYHRSHRNGTGALNGRRAIGGPT